MFFRSLFSIFIAVISVLNSKAEYPEWRIVETLAEENPYVVALLNYTKDYVCSGTTIGKRTVLTSGFCISTDPTYVAVGLAVINKKKLTNLLDVAYTLVHSDYTYIMNTTDPGLSQMHSNIGLVFVVRPVLDEFLPPATIGSYFASELTDIELTSIGYGRRYTENQNQNVFVLQYQCYDQSPCVNPRWYYCICGTEVATAAPTRGKDFGNGAPILFGSDVVCISATSTGAPMLTSVGIKYNIFTVIGAYIPWIEKTETFKVVNPRARGINNKAEHNLDYDRTLLYAVLIFLVVR